MDLYPINLKIKDRNCIVVGGGDVACRKIRELLVCGARVTVISPEVSEAITAMAAAEEINWQARTYQQGDLNDAFLVFAATDNPEVQKSVGAEALKKGILFNCVDNPRACSFQVPAKVRRGDFMLTVSTGGGSPAFAAQLRRQLALEYGREYEPFIDLLGRIRTRIVGDGQSAESHKIVFEKLLQLNILAQIRRQDWSAIERDLHGILPEEIDIKELIEGVQLLDQQDNEQNSGLGER